METKPRDLAAELFALLHAQSPDHASRWRALFINLHPGWTNGPLPPENVQIREINEFWRVQLGLLSNDTLRPRSCLVDDVSPDEWLRNFKRYVMKAVLGQQIPNQVCHSVCV